MSQTGVNLLPREDAEQAGSRQALLSTALHTAGIQQQDDIWASTDEQPWTGADSATGVPFASLYSCLALASAWSTFPEATDAGRWVSEMISQVACQSTDSVL